MTGDKAPPPSVAFSKDWIAVCSLGGTMQCMPGADGSLMPVAGLDQTLLQSTAPRGMRILVDNVRVLPSAALDLQAVADILDAADRHVQDGATAIVVTMGTDMLEEAAFALDLLWDHPQPLVVTGSMRAPTALSADGPANLRSALLVADSPQAVDLGCLIVLNDEIHAAWQVHKSHTSSPAAFRSPASGPIGQITEDVVRIVTRPMQRPRLPRPQPAITVPVALLTGSLGDDGRMVRSVLELGYHGLVIQASGGGSVPPSWSGPLRTVADRIPVVYASRAGSGAALQRSYGGPGSERDLVQLGIQPGGMLDATRCRILLQLLLAIGASPVQRRQCFTAFDTPGSWSGSFPLSHRET